MLPITYSLQKNSQLRASFISALTIGASLLITNDESQQQSLDKRGQVHKYYQTTSTLIDCSEQLLRRYERTQQGIHDVNEPSNPEKEWVGDCQKLRDLFDLKESRTKQQMNNHISVGYRRAEYLNPSTSEEVWTVFAEAGDAVKEKVEGAQEPSWTETAGRLKSDVQRLMRHVEES